jgi:hypothetical protein
LAEPVLARARVADQTKVQITPLLFGESLKFPTNLVGGIPDGSESLVTLLVDAGDAFRHEARERHEGPQELLLLGKRHLEFGLGKGARPSKAEAEPSEEGRRRCC